MISPGEEKKIEATDTIFHQSSEFGGMCIFRTTKHRDKSNVAFLEYVFHDRMV